MKELLTSDLMKFFCYKILIGINFASVIASGYSQEFRLNHIISLEKEIVVLHDQKLKGIPNNVLNELKAIESHSEFTKLSEVSQVWLGTFEYPDSFFTEMQYFERLHSDCLLYTSPSPRD